MNIFQDNNLKQELISKLIENQSKYVLNTDLILLECRETELECSCGGKLIQRSSILDPIKRAFSVAGPRPKVKTRKKRKIKLAQWRRKFDNAKFAATLCIPISHRIFYVCKNCEKQMGYYEAIGKNLVKIEPLK